MIDLVVNALDFHTWVRQPLFDDGMADMPAQVAMHEGAERRIMRGELEHVLEAV